MAQEAISLVGRAASMRQSHPSKDGFCRAVSAAVKELKDRDLSVFVLHNDGTYLACAGDPQKINSRLQDDLGLDGESLLTKITQLSSQESGWFEYEYNDPKKNKIHSMMMFIQALDDVYIGCNVIKEL